MKQIISIEYIIAFVILCCLVSCKQNDIDTIYVDKDGVIHTTENCHAIGRRPLLAVSLTDIDSAFVDGFEPNICSTCIEEKQRGKIEKAVLEYKNRRIAEAENKAREEERRRNEFHALCFIGKDKWGDFDSYHNYIVNRENDSLLNEELRREGWHGLFDLSSAYRRLERNSHRHTNVLWNESSIRYLYLKLSAEGINVGSLNEFELSLSNMDSFVWYYNTANKLGIIDSWENYLMFMFEADCEDCKEEYWEEWLEEAKEELMDDEIMQQEMMEQYYEEMNDYYDDGYGRYRI